MLEQDAPSFSQLTEVAKQMLSYFGRSARISYGTEEEIMLSMLHCKLLSNNWLDLARFNKIAIQGTPQMAVDKEAISLSGVY